MRYRRKQSLAMFFVVSNASVLGVFFVLIPAPDPAMHDTIGRQSARIHATLPKFKFRRRGVHHNNSPLALYLVCHSSSWPHPFQLSMLIDTLPRWECDA